MRFLFFSSLVLLVIFGGPVVGLAEENETLCLAVFPCDPDTGHLLDMYDDATSPCFDYWRMQCIDYRLNNLSEDLSSCKANLDASTKRVERVRRKLKRARRSTRR